MTACMAAKRAGRWGTALDMTRFTRLRSGKALEVDPKSPEAALAKAWAQLSYGAHHDAITGSNRMGRLRSTDPAVR